MAYITSEVADAMAAEVTLTIPYSIRKSRKGFSPDETYYLTVEQAIDLVDRLVDSIGGAQRQNIYHSLTNLENGCSVCDPVTEEQIEQEKEHLAEKAINNPTLWERLTTLMYQAGRRAGKKQTSDNHTA